MGATFAPNMNITLVGICPTSAMKRAGKPALTPELLAATGARYSRNNEGLEEILKKIDPNDPDKSAKSIFKMVDYGHQSIADMAPVVMFMDGISQWLAYHVWSECPVASGQEASTRYIPMKVESLINPDLLGIPTKDQEHWYHFSRTAFEHYHAILDFWGTLVENHPELLRVPSELLASTNEKDQLKVNRIKRNFPFDRARYWIPLGVATNMMLVMSAREWVKLASHLKSHYLLEAQQLGKLIADNLELVTPQLTRHAIKREYIQKEILNQFEDSQNEKYPPVFGQKSVTPFLEVSVPKDVTHEDVCRALENHENRYAEPGPAISSIGVRFGWNRVAVAEIRDLNRHRTGTKRCKLIPRGFYSAEEECTQETEHNQEFQDSFQWGLQTSNDALMSLKRGEPEYVYSTLLGTQYSFEHTTTADKFIYEWELRTGVGAHYRYAAHLRAVGKIWFRHFPKTRGLILEGSAEPE